jgi:hypothetical protein
VEAARACARVLRSRPTAEVGSRPPRGESEYPEQAYQIALEHAYGGEIDEAFAWLDRAYEARDSGLAWFLRTDPMLANIKGDPRYVALLRKMKLPEGSQAE